MHSSLRNYSKISLFIAEGMQRVGHQTEHSINSLAVRLSLPETGRTERFSEYWIQQAPVISASYISSSAHVYTCMCVHTQGRAGRRVTDILQVSAAQKHAELQPALAETSVLAAQLYSQLLRPS